jgi:hypothetical protein
MENNKNIKVIRVSPISHHNITILEAGKKILLDSVDVSRNFCNEMIITSTSAIAIYLGLLKFIRPEYYEKVDLSVYESILIMIPAFLFLIASVIFSIGYYPRKKKISLDSIESIENARDSIIDIREKLSFIGLSVFSLGVVMAIIIIIINRI